ncbi:hypothetical protein RO3G_10902 [Rhizopus delemar RA 99-880]|uniref:Uncharacterized protein n=1 Tax=Rhizopus delemar (strain RA 99-880 / ATCC MYA-4621 / FGSC 9543 / NRRL 43880) TaxID=246409 RepID=I1CCL1_RHIO9|nr:hypothetical protein RO3G_10902 [Rhizopus delemar RA 99-880]|eukprot:EIE86191.1 hypothetical protein RO3G_10902 [Rhizopus delemar RA 99-880]
MFLTRKERADSIDADKPIYIITENVDNSEKISYAATKVNFYNWFNEETVYLGNGNSLKSK